MAEGDDGETSPNTYHTSELHTHTHTHTHREYPPPPPHTHALVVKESDIYVHLVENRALLFTTFVITSHYYNNLVKNQASLTSTEEPSTSPWH